MTRDDEIQEFLAAAGWAGARRRPLAGDASGRRYERLTRPVSPQSCVLMDAPAQGADSVRPFLRIARHLSFVGLSAPAILTADPDRGLLLLEDLGDALFARILERAPERETDLYVAATDALLELHRHPLPGNLPAFGPDEMAAATDVTLTWYAAGCGQPAPDGAITALAGRVRDHLLALPGDHPVLALRDFHAENLLWLPDRSGAARVGLLDFQDAFPGHPAYDLVSLLEDARRDVSDTARHATLAHYVAGSGADPDALALACATLGAQRNLRILGVFARLSMQHGKAHYIDLIPRVWGHLRRDLAHPALAPLAAFVDAHVPEPTAARLASIREKCGTCPTP